MDATIGRYKVSTDDRSLMLTHEAGITFDLTPAEALGLMDFIRVYQQTLQIKQRETDPALKRVHIVKVEDES